MTHDWWRKKPAKLERSRTSELPFWGLLGFTLVLMLSPQTTFPFLKVLRPALSCAGLAIAVILLERFHKRRPLFAAQREVWLAAALVAWSVITLPFSFWPSGSVGVLKDMFIKSVAIFWVISTVIDSERRLRTLFWVMALVSVPLGATAIKNYIEGVFIRNHSVERIVGFDAPLTANPNDLALMLNIIAPMAVALGLSAHKRSTRYIMAGVVGLIVVAIVATFSRAGFVTMLTLFAVYVAKLLDGPKKSWALVAIFGAVLLLPALPATFVDHLETSTTPDEDTTGSAQTRWQDASAAIEFIAGNPVLGAGLGQHVVALARHGGSWHEVHNVYLEHAADLGLPGLALFVAMLVACWRGIRWAQRASARHSPGLFRMAEGLELSLAAFAVGAMFHPIAYHFYFYYVAGLAVAARVIAQGLQGARAWAR